ncbi:pyridoxal phosphate-dependent aminotransferase [Candidatus Microthrix sp.]|uniref:pyridoxal phosphate-dependent aminotransferase n=1 Tax=Candidatus Neomicrothrix sp. TaxID=2719034 RepID=UPI002592201D|nr:aminotransferase class I/II-fold pyridoxal phosphate-dependent enzyme [Candidatus Microthrix sp.]HMS48465.1 aminotransferase class I/II-fold pyridoxal phosphate-dependent enzyme [Candidatus Microthrix sp.]
MSLIRPAVRDDVALIPGYHSPQLDVAVRLNTNEAPEPPPADFGPRLAEALAGADWNRYPDRGAEALRTRIAEVEGTTPDRVFAANGSNEVLQSLALAYGGAGRRALTFEPTYALHSHICRVTGTEVVSEPRAEDFTLAPDTVGEAIARHRPALVFLCNPNNPTGVAEDPDTVRAALEACGETGTLLVVDEAYGQFAPWSAIELVRGVDDADAVPMVVTRTFSKTWSMAAVRLGYLLGPTWLIEDLERVALPYHLDVMTQAAGELALDYVGEMDRRVSRITEQRGWIEARLAELPVRTWPSSANFLLFRPDDGSGEEVWQALVDRGVLVRNCASWPGLEGCLRVTVGTPEENRVFIDALGLVLNIGQPPLGSAVDAHCPEER